MNIASLIILLIKTMNLKSKILITPHEECDLDLLLKLKKIEDFFLIELVKKSDLVPKATINLNNTQIIKTNFLEFFKNIIFGRLKEQTFYFYKFYITFSEKLEILLDITKKRIKKVNFKKYFLRMLMSFKENAFKICVRISLKKKEYLKNNSNHFIAILLLPMIPFIIKLGYHTYINSIKLSKLLLNYAFREYFFMLELLQFLYTLCLLVSETPGIWSNDYSALRTHN